MRLPRRLVADAQSADCGAIRGRSQGHVVAIAGIVAILVVRTRGNSRHPSGPLRAVSANTLRSWMQRAQARAGLPLTSGVHILRHTFCSHLAMRGVPAKVIQELAGHADLTTTMRYMHLAKGSKEAAIAVLDQPAPKNGDLLETQTPG